MIKTERKIKNNKNKENIILASTTHKFDSRKVCKLCQEQDIDADLVIDIKFIPSTNEMSTEKISCSVHGILYEKSKIDTYCLYNELYRNINKDISKNDKNHSTKSKQIGNVK